ncbi:MAG: polyhydroxyalkanoic acid system family protein [Deltaproteobacteria bacterium]|nr:polyhydroxyalkanoic acid system family protein [Deltaproteobacteria bacterium]MBK8234349.1 polyhydroxyalkanoic acid system family protein [Deltaproteobacteria bacterium]MBK8715071.1 polyhydroxyalkanoic acid system family protein [Deltaproteobacteria bacterium]MBP7287087.1 polyhydroxyalkanoic acid system family protein [Nannocystaceae bacterium]
MKYVAKHGLSDRARARAVVEKAYEAYKVKLADHNPSLTWKSENAAVLGFTVLGKTINADIEVGPEELRVEGDMPFLFRPFQGKVEKVLGEEIEKWIAKAKAGEI